MSARLVPAAALLAAAFLVAPAAATERGPYKVRSGGSAVILTYASYNPDTCYFGALPRLTVVQPPAHGSVSPGVTTGTSNTTRCAGKTFKWTTLTYQSKGGFRGRDTVVVDVETDVYVNGIGKRSDRVAITVDVQ